MEVSVVFWLVIGAVAVAGVIGNSYAATKKNALIESLIEKGQPIPPQLFEGRKLYDWRGFMVAGVVFTASGVALLIFFLALTTWQQTDPEQRFLPSISAFPISIGVAFLVIARYLKNNE
jgi:uncharacterized protein DUF6249